MFRGLAQSMFKNISNTVTTLAGKQNTKAGRKRRGKEVEMIGSNDAPIP